MNIVKSLVEGYSKINTATRTGAIDVVFVEQEDGTFASTPFHVRFGKLGVVWSGSKCVDIEINGKEVDMSMVLDDRGMAFFSEKDDHGETDDVDEEGNNGSERGQRDEVRLNQRNRPEMQRTRSMSSSDISEFDLPAEHESKLSAASRAISDGDLSENKEEEVVVEEEETNKRNSLRLTKAEIGHLGLNLGCNSAVFSVTTRFQGTYKASCNIHLWRQRDRIVISDIDGTITRSDVRGMLLPLIGASNWAQGEVVRLYNLIADNGYRILYLSARSISQAADTKFYLEQLRQDGLSLPPGPLFLNPKSLLQAGKLEVIEKRPELFKIECLTKLRELFLCPTPFFAGYGNRQNDLVAYQAVGIPSCRVFLINKLGILSGQVALNQQSSYCGHCDLVSLLFPALSTSTNINLATKEIGCSNSPSFWSPPLPQIDPEDPLLSTLTK